MKRILFIGLIVFTLLIFTLPTTKAQQANLIPASRSVWIHQTTAQGELPIPTEATQQTAALLLDINQDGRDDFVIGTRRGKEAPGIVWYESTPNGWQRHPLEPENLAIEAGGDVFDIDGDGDLDISFGADEDDNAIWWWENPYPDYSAGQWQRHVIKNSGSNKHHDQIFGDFDGDGEIELVFWNQLDQSLNIAELPADPTAADEWDYRPIFSWEGDGRYEGLAKADIDGDGLIDIVGAGHWFKFDGDAQFAAQPIDIEQTFTRAAVGQLVPGGRPEIAFVAGDARGPINWYQWNGSDWEKNDLLPYDVDHGHSLDIADLDQDGHLDIFVAEMRLNGNNKDAAIWIFYGDGSGNFEETLVTTGFGAHEARLGDLDGDGDLDILSKPYNWQTPRVDIFLNNGTNGQLGRSVSFLGQWERHVIDDDKPWRSVFVKPALIDADEWPDVVVGAWWYKNPGSLTEPWTRAPIGAPLNNMAAVFDFDGNGTLDVLGTEGEGSEANADLVWASNDGSGSFTVRDNIESANGAFLQGVTVMPAPLADEMPTVLLSWQNGVGGLQRLTLPNNPETAVWQWDQLSPTALGEDLDHGDIDGDNDIDILLGTTWLRNDGNGWTAVSLHEPDEGQSDRVNLVDIDQDGDLDAIMTYGHDIEGKFAWYEQPDDDPEALWTEHIIGYLGNPLSMEISDMDGDGDVDAVVGERLISSQGEITERSRLLLFENVDGVGGSWDFHLVYRGEEHHDGAQIIDIDLDGDKDIISIGWDHDRVVIYENVAIDYRLFMPLVFSD